MRQAGILAACGIVSLTRMVSRLAEDHDRAKRLADSLQGIPGLTVDLSSVQTNMVLITTEGPSEPWLNGLKAQGIWALPPAVDRIRCVFHNDVSDEMTDRTAAAFREIGGSFR